MARHLSVLALAALMLAASATAADIGVRVTVRPGPLALGPTTATPGSSRIAATVIDARGTGVGWTLSAVAPAVGDTPAVVTSVTVGCGRHSTCTLPRAPTRYPVTLSTSHPTTVLAARPHTGIGTITVTLTLAAPLPPGRVRLTLNPNHP